jgi:hypothetical protein
MHFWMLDAGLRGRRRRAAWRRRQILVIDASGQGRAAFAAEIRIIGQRRRATAPARISFGYARVSHPPKTQDLGSAASIKTGSGRNQTQSFRCEIIEITVMLHARLSATVSGFI